MIHDTQGLVLHTLKYGETSLIISVFTARFGVQSYLVQGVRQPSAKGRGSRAGLLQPCSLLDLVVYHKPGKNLQRIREFSPAVLYQSLHENVIKNSIALFSAELLYRLLPEDAPMPELFDFAARYLREIDAREVAHIANYPVWFALQCARALGFPLQGRFTDETPYLNQQEGGFSATPPPLGSPITTLDGAQMGRLAQARSPEAVALVPMDADTRNRLLAWWLEYLHRHTDHMKPIRSLRILQDVLH